MEIISEENYPPTSTLSSKYQLVIPKKIRRLLGLTKGDEVVWRTSKEGKKTKVSLIKKPESWVDYYHGSMKGTWKNEDIDEYINKLRDEWDDK